MTGLSETEREAAALALGKAVRDFLKQGISFEWRKVVAKSLNLASVDRTTFDEVVSQALDSGFLIHRKTSTGVTRLFPGPRLSPPDPQKKSDPSEMDPIEKKAAADSSRIPPKRPFPENSRCSKCGWEATLCVHCSRPSFDDDIYVDSKGEWKCGSCNDLCFKDSWGGVKRWNREDEH